MKRALIITYYWPPSGGSGVQRWLRFSGCVRENGWEPVVATVANAEFPVIDPSLIDVIPDAVETLRLPIWEPYSLYKRFTGQHRSASVAPGFVEIDRKPRLRERAARWIRGNFFIPDARRFWIKPSTRRLTQYLRANPVDVIITTGPPMSVHLIGLGLKKTTSIPWLADFRDPWTTVFYQDGFLLGRRARSRHADLEARVLAAADHVTVVGSVMKEELDKKTRRGVSVITNGYAPEECVTAERLADRFSIVVVGTLMRSQNCPALWRVLRRLVDRDAAFAKDLQIRFTGLADIEVRADVERHGLGRHLVVSDYVRFSDVPQVHARAQVLLLLVNRGPNGRCIVTGKLFGYLASRRPILCIGRLDGDAAKIVGEAGAGLVAEHDDEAGIEAHVLTLYDQFRSGGVVPVASDIDQYRWEAQAQRLTRILDELASAAAGMPPRQESRQDR